MISLLEPSTYPPVADIKFPCPHCTRHLEAPSELAGAEVDCPVCGKGLTIPSPAETAEAPGSKAGNGRAAGNGAAAASEMVKYWMADVRVLVLRAPPVYLTVLIEAPKGWMPPADGVLPAPALEAVIKGVRRRYPQCPITPARLRAADPDSLKRTAEEADYSGDHCKVWLIGKAAPAL